MVGSEAKRIRLYIQRSRHWESKDHTKGVIGIEDDFTVNCSTRGDEQCKHKKPSGGKSSDCKSRSLSSSPGKSSYRRLTEGLNAISLDGENQTNDWK